MDPYDWRQVTHWIFDMDGTLTVSIHDFEEMRRDLGLPKGKPILESIRELDSARASEVTQQLNELELELASQATEQQGAAQLLEELLGRGMELGILTRNSEANAWATLRATKLDSFFSADAVYGREHAPPKPDPAGVQMHLARWKAAPHETVILGDYLFDLQAGRNAGIRTIYLDLIGGFQHRKWADVCVLSLADVNAALRQR